MEKYIFEMNEDTKDKIEKIIKTFDLDVHIAEQQMQEENEWPQDGVGYYFIDGDCEIIYGTRFCSGDTLCKNILSIGNCFKTKEEAEFEVERRKVITEMKKFAEPEDREWNRCTEHWVICIDMTYNHIDYLQYLNSKSDCIYFKTKEKAKECVKAIGEYRIRKYYLRIEK